MDDDQLKPHISQESFFSRPGLQHKLLKKLKSGKLPIEDEIDLHGFRLIDAENELNAFLESAKNEGLRTIKIIHGKGYSSERGPVIKEMTHERLKQDAEVLAFSSTLPRDGGTGAVYVLLKRKRE